jgi:RNA polymerase sigma-70 factor (ECF subfamily)
MSATATHLDNALLDRCLEHQPRSWEDFVDRFLGLVLHVIDHTASKREARLRAEERSEMCERVFAALAYDQFRLLREFKARSSLTTYLSVIVRRIVVRLLLNQVYGSAQVTFDYPSSFLPDRQQQEHGRRRSA